MKCNVIYITHQELNEAEIYQVKEGGHEIVGAEDRTMKLLYETFYND